MTNSDEYGLENLSSACSNIIHFECVAHTVHLAVSDTINEVNIIRNCIEKCRSISKKLRSPNRFALAKKIGFRKAMIDYPSRWNSTFDMLKRMLDYKT